MPIRDIEGHRQYILMCFMVFEMQLKDKGFLLALGLKKVELTDCSIKRYTLLKKEGLSSQTR